MAIDCGDYEAWSRKVDQLLRRLGGGAASTGYAEGPIWSPPTDVFETGEGVVGFTSPDEAVKGAEEIQRRYPEHCLAARTVAEEYFDSGKVLSRLIELAGKSSTV